MTWKSFWRSVGRDVEHAATGVASFANHVVDKTASVVESLGGDAVKVAHKGRRSFERRLIFEYAPRDRRSWRSSVPLA